MKNTPAFDMENIDTQDTGKIPISKLKQDVANRKLNKSQRNDKKNSNVISWGELHPMVNTLHEMLTEFANIGLLGNQCVAAFPAEQATSLTTNISALFQDITLYMNQLLLIKGKVKEANIRVTSDEIVEFYTMYEDLDSLRTDICTVITPTAAFISAMVDTVNIPKEPTHD